MTVYARAFCRASSAPTLQQVIEWARSQDVELQVLGDAELLNRSDWREAQILYSPHRPPLHCALDWTQDPPRGRAEQEIAAFLERLQALEPSLETAHAIEHLQQTRFIVANRLDEEMEDEAFEVSSLWLTYFEQFCDGLIQADGEGFYLTGELLVEEE